MLETGLFLASSSLLPGSVLTLFATYPAVGAPALDPASDLNGLRTQAALWKTMMGAGWRVDQSHRPALPSPTSADTPRRSGSKDA